MRATGVHEKDQTCSKALQRYDTLPFRMPELAMCKKIREMILKVLVLLPELNKTETLNQVKKAYDQQWVKFGKLAWRS